MNPKKLAEAYRTLSMGYAELADAYLDEPETIATRINEARDKISESFNKVANHVAAPSFDDLPPDPWPDDDRSVPLATGVAESLVPQGSAAVCPKHRTPYKDGKYGLFCTSPSDEPKPWTNDKGYCRITPKNAAEWLRERASVTA